MLPKINFNTTQAFQEIQTYLKETGNQSIKNYFKEDQARFEKYHIQYKNILFDFSKNRFDDHTFKLLINLAEECLVEQARAAMFSGEAINETENRSVLHIALRNLSDQPIFSAGKDVMPEVNRVLKQMESFSQEVISGTWKGYSDKAITDVVNIGIGGSDLGPVMVTEALKHYKNHLNMHFISNIDATQLLETLKNLNPETTLFLVASKTFSTLETMTNAASAKDWLMQSGATPQDIKKHFVAISTNTQAVEAFGIPKTQMFEFWDWVGGRYSLWSAIGLSIMLSLGPKHFKELLSGAHDMDTHFKEAPLAKNIPVIMALIGVLYINFYGAQTQAILPYDQYLHRFSAYFQQGDMESNGKHINRNGKAVNYNTGPIVWGQPGTNGQHAFFQLLHQGTHLIPADFIAPAQSLNPLGKHHEILLSNFFAQTQALMNGKNLIAVEVELRAEGMDNEAISQQAPFRTFEGNNPSNSILLKKVTPYNLGKLIAMYEHKIFVQGVIWNIYSFDQWGVELGKQLANKILPDLENNQATNEHDASTNGLINQFKSWRLS